MKQNDMMAIYIDFYIERQTKVSENSCLKTTSSVVSCNDNKWNYYRHIFNLKVRNKSTWSDDNYINPRVSLVWFPSSTVLLARCRICYH